MKFPVKDVWSYCDKTYEVSAESRWREGVTGLLKSSIHSIHLFHWQLSFIDRSEWTLT